ncbi:glycosyltransferase family 2 protein [bacterium]|nr:glycosyltransferase family 2 protein [bacterium]
MPVSIIVPVKNEEANLRRYLKSLLWADEIFVVDSQSTDKTVEVAEQHGAQVVQFHFNGTYPKKKNWSLENLPFRNEWVLIVDADEEVPKALVKEIAQAIKSTEYDGYDIHFRYFFMGGEIKHCGYADLRVLRLFRHKLGRYEKMPTKAGQNSGDNEAHEHVILQGKMGKLKNSIKHYPYPSIAVWVEKHNRYSTWEADLYEQFLRGGFKEGEKHLDRKKYIKRRLKQVFLRLPFRFVFRFIYAYFFRLGFLDKRQGFVLCFLLMFYDFMAWAKVYEAQATKK